MNSILRSQIHHFIYFLQDAYEGIIKFIGIFRWLKLRLSKVKHHTYNLTASE